ncbi:MAG: c-type cytochrome [Rhizobiaceae bacterium]|nr:c-type cytochrome [Rhizobiaceae bacterium]
MPFMRKLIAGAIVLAALGAIVGWVLSAPRPLEEAEIGAVSDGAETRGERVFWAGGCASCHAAPKAEGEARLKMVGGLELETPFGTFVAPNISSHETDGIGAWSLGEFANAMQRGVSPDGAHYYPAFPYTSYARMEPADIADLYAFMKTLPPVEGKAPPHQVSFPFNIRRGLGLWKLLYTRDAPVVEVGPETSDAVVLGRYLVEGPGHCGECHTPRDMFGGTQYNAWLSGASAATGEGTIPNITPGGDVGGWSEDEIAEYLNSGFTPDFDSAGGEMASVIKNLANLEPGDRGAIAAYLKQLPSLPDGHP